MVSRLHTRLERIEAAPIVNLTRERRESRRKVIESFRAFIQPDLDEQVVLAQYCGIQLCRETQEGDIIEQTFLSVAEHHERYGDARLDSEQSAECVFQADIKFYREVYGVELTPEDLLGAGEVGEQAREDMRAGVPVSESEAAQIMIANYTNQPARLKKHTDDFAAYMAGLDSRIPECEFRGEDGES